MTKEKSIKKTNINEAIEAITKLKEKNYELFKIFKQQIECINKNKS